MNPEKMAANNMPLIEQAEEQRAIIQAACDIVDEELRRVQACAAEDIQDQEDTGSVSVRNSGLVDINVVSKQTEPSPYVVESKLPVPEGSQMAQTTRRSRDAIAEILRGEDNRLIAIVGPCSIHNAEEAIAYAKQLAIWREKYGDTLEIVMRAYFEKPRSEKGWKGLVYDPRLNESDDVTLGLILTRMLAMRITDLGVPIATERLNALTPQYLNGLIAYDAIGARNTTDQKAREYASSTSSPVGFKNTPDGNIEDAVSAMVAAHQPHTLLGMSELGLVSSVKSRGNRLAHLILRGGKGGPNYAPRYVRRAKAIIAQKADRSGENLLAAIVIDANHGNSGKVAANQARVIRSVARQVAAGETAIKGVMLESNLRAGNQPIGDGKNLEYGISVTDECISVNDTEVLLGNLAQAVIKRRKALAS